MKATASLQQSFILPSPAATCLSLQLPPSTISSALFITLLAVSPGNHHRSVEIDNHKCSFSRPFLLRLSQSTITFPPVTPSQASSSPSPLPFQPAVLGRKHIAHLTVSYLNSSAASPHNPILFPFFLLVNFSEVLLGTLLLLLAACANGLLFVSIPFVQLSDHLIMPGIWASYHTSKHSIVFRSVVQERLNDRLAELYKIRRRALASTQLHVILEARDENELKPLDEPGIFNFWDQEQAQDCDDNGESALSLIEEYNRMRDMGLVQSDGDSAESFDYMHSFLDQTLAKTSADQPTKPLHILEQPHNDSFPYSLQKILDANDSARALITKFLESVLGIGQEGTDVPSIETQIKDRIRLFIDDADLQKKAYEDTLQDGRIILDHDPSEEEYDPPLATNFEYSGLMNGRSSRYPVRKDDIEQLDNIICKTLSAKEKLKEATNLALNAFATHQKRYRSSKLGGGVVNFMKTGGKGSGLIQSTKIGEEWPADWSILLNAKPRHMISKEYAQAAEEMAAADALTVSKRNSARNPKW